MSDGGPTDEFELELAWPEQPGVRGASRPAGVPEPRPVSGDTEPAGPGDAGGPEPLRAHRIALEAQQRLAAAVLEPLQLLRQDLDADLAEIRAELTLLRQQVAEPEDRVPGRQLRSDLHALHAEVTGLRAEVAGMRDELRSVEVAARARPAAAAGTGSEHLAELLADLTDVVGVIAERPVLPALAPLLEEIVGLRADLVALKRRIAVRAIGEGARLDEVGEVAPPSSGSAARRAPTRRAR